MASEVDPYWKIFAEEVPSDLGIAITDEQVADLAYALEGAHENYGLHSGRDVADANWKAQNEREIAVKSAGKVLEFLQARLDDLDQGSSKFFDHMSHKQRIAMGELFLAKEMLRKDGII